MKQRICHLLKDIAPEYPCWIWNDATNNWERQEGSFKELDGRHTHWTLDTPESPELAPLDY
jgi:hypothetical protein